MAINVCTGCGVSTDADTCPNGCESSVTPGEPKATIPWAMIPENCWDCGAVITTPPHLRKFQGQCDNCTAKALGKVN